VVKKITTLFLAIVLLFNLALFNVPGNGLSAFASQAESAGQVYYYNTFDFAYDIEGSEFTNKTADDDYHKVEVTEDGSLKFHSIAKTGATSDTVSEIRFKPTFTNTSENKQPLVLEYKVKFDVGHKSSYFCHQAGVNSSNLYTHGIQVFPYLTESNVNFSREQSIEKFTFDGDLSDWHTVSIKYSATDDTKELYWDGVYKGKSTLTDKHANRWNDEGILGTVRFYNAAGKNDSAVGMTTLFDYLKVYEAPADFTIRAVEVSSEALIVSFNNIPVGISKDNFSFGNGVGAKTVKKIDETTYLITPDSPLAKGAECTLLINGVKDTIANNLSNNSLSFTPKKDKLGLTANQPVIVQDGIVKSEFESMALPVSAKADVYNYGDKEDSARLYLAGYKVDENGAEILEGYTYKDIKVAPYKKETVTTSDLDVNGSVIVKAFIWDTDTLLPLADFKETKFSYKSSETGIPVFYSTKNAGSVSYAKNLCRSTTGLVNSADGTKRYHTYITLIGNPAYIYEFDTLTGEYINRIAAGNGQHLALCVGSDGNLYHVPAGSSSLYKYNPATKENTQIEKFYSKVVSTWLMNPGADGNRDKLYISSQPYDDTGIPCVEFDVKTQEITIHNSFDTTAKYSHTATGNDKYIFVEVGAKDEDGNTHTTLVRRNRQTGEDVRYVDPVGNTDYYPLRIAGNVIVMDISNTSKVIDIETMEVINSFEGKSTHPGPQSISFPDPDNPDIFYYIEPGAKGLGQYSISENKVSHNVTFSNVYDQMGFLDFGTWVKKEDGTNAIVAVGGNNDLEYDMFLITPGNAEIEKITPPELIDGNGVETQPCFYYVTEDDVLYVGGYESGMNAFDLKTNTQIFTDGGGKQHNDIQYSMTMVGDKLFAGTYSHGNIYMVNTKSTKPVPQKVFAGANNVVRYYDSCDTNAGFGLFAGGIYYSGTSGGIYLITYKDGKAQRKFYGDVIPGENIVSVDYKDGYIYASSCNQLPSGTAANSHVAKINAKTGVTEKMVTVNIPEIGDTHRVIGCISLGPDGLLYGLLPDYAIIFALNPETLGLVKYHRIDPSFSKETLRLYAARLYFGADGIIYTTLTGKVLAVNPENWTHTVIREKGSYMGMDNEGNILMPSGTSGNGNTLDIILVNQHQRLEQMIKTCEKYYVVNKDTYTLESYTEFEEAFNKAKSLDLSIVSDELVKETARELTFAIKHLTTKYDAQQGFAYPFN